MSFTSKLASFMLGLPPASYPKLEYQLDIPIPMRDGTILLANRIAPRGGEKLPIILIRNPYNSRGNKPDFMSVLIAERGYQVVMQNCRGTWGSGGEFHPFSDEREDGLTTLKWLEDQPWFSDRVGMYGLSYFGYAQLAAGPGAPDYVKALVPQMAASRIYGVFRSHGTLCLALTLTWHYQTFVSNAQTSTRDKKRANARLNEALQEGYRHLPTGEADKVTLGSTSPFFQDILHNDQPDDAFWTAMDHSKLVGKISAPVHFIGGWYDFFLADQLNDYISMRDAGKEPYLTIGPWSHFSNAGLKEGFNESFMWYDAFLRGNRTALRPLPVRVCVMGINKWVDMPCWPPPATATNWYLQAGGQLTPDAPNEKAEPSRYVYDPSDPTPSVGGRVFLSGGQKDNHKLEERQDVLTFTSGPMDRNMTIVGKVAANLYVRSTAEHTDFYARLCDVSPNGRKSMNICEGIIRLTPDAVPADIDGIRQVTIDLFSTAYCFKANHRIRLQVSSGAHPVYIRNLGTGEPITTGTTMFPAEQEVLHDEGHPSAIVLPIACTPP